MSEFVYVYRKDHNDYMHILEEVQIKYPDKFEVVVEDKASELIVEEKKEEVPVKVTRTSTKKK